jgi:hypothetical protein
MNPKLLILYKTAVLNNEIYNLTRLYCNNFENVTSYFIVCDDTIAQDVLIEDQIIKVKLIEDNWNSILIKVIKSFELFKTQDYTHVMVSNISTIVNIPIVYQLISTHDSNVKCMSVMGDYTFNNIRYNFPSGAGYVFTMDLINAVCNFFDSNTFIVNNKLTSNFLNNFPTTDDIFFGYYLHMNRIKITPIPRLNVIVSDFVLNIKTDLNYSHYRIKTGNYGDDVKFFSHILKSLYPQLYS